MKVLLFDIHKMYDGKTNNLHQRLLLILLIFSQK